MTDSTRLLLMRHGEAEPFAASDQDRALSPRGVKETRQLAAWLGQAVPDIGLVCHSPYLRARQTADQVCHILGSPNRLTLNSLVPSAEPTAVLTALETTEFNTVLCISHQPLVGNLRSYLVEGGYGGSYPFVTAGVTLLECDFLGAGGASMTWFRCPADIV